MDYTKEYYKCERPELANFILAGPNRVLDIGCAEGALGKSLKQRGMAQEVVGIELFKEAAKIAETRLDRVLCGDIEALDWGALGLAEGTFDYILCGDVLEHLRDPWRVLTWLTSLLKNDGKLIASVPNVRHWSVIFPLLFLGRWTYRPHGIMDRTHLRFFTRKSAMQMFEDCGLKVDTSEGSSLRGKKDKLFNLAMLGMAPELVTIQWTLVGHRLT